VSATISLLGDARFWQAVVITHQALLLGYLISVLLGVPLGLAMARFPVAGRLADVYLSLLLIVPTAAVAPLLIMSLGIGLGSRVVVIVAFAIVMIVANVRAGVRGVDPEMINAARVFGASERQVWTRVLIPGAAPAISAGLRIGLSRAIQGAVIIELLMIPVGVGGLMLEYQGFFRPEYLYATVAIIVFEALLLAGGGRWLEQRLLGAAFPERPGAGIRPGALPSRSAS
jgi:NitT/TauT family transport system permease protein